MDSLERRKLRMRASVERMDNGQLLVEANSLFIRAKTWQYLLIRAQVQKKSWMDWWEGKERFF